jgi:signal transduction histidine kinase
MKGVHLLADIPLSLPRFMADPERFEHVLANLVSNALKFTPEGGRITVGGREQGGRIVVSVADTGRGIPPEDLPRLFARFAQADVAQQRAKNIKGTGLGLYIVKTSVEGMGGTVSVESRVGHGTRFLISLPKERA